MSERRQLQEFAVGEKKRDIRVRVRVRVMVRVKVSERR